MIIYKTTDNKWRIPRSIVKNNSGSWAYSDNIRRKNGSGWDINWHRNSSNFNAVGGEHPFWVYSMNPYFNISENNLFSGPGGELEISYDTGFSNPNSSGRYTAGSGQCWIYASKDSNNAGDCILKSKFPLNVVDGATYRSRVEIDSMSPLSQTFGVMPCRYYRLIIDSVRDSANANSVQLSEFRLFDINGNNLSATYSGSGNYPSGEGPAQAGDGSLSTKWLDFTQNGSVLNVTFSSNTTIGGYRMATANDEPARDPGSWRVQASTDNSTWITIATVTGYDLSFGARQAWNEDFELQTTILTGFWSGTTYDTADKGAAGFATRWGPRFDIGRTTSASGSNIPWGDGTYYSYSYFSSTKVLNFDTQFPSGHVWARPIIKIGGKSISTTNTYYKINNWKIIRIT